MLHGLNDCTTLMNISKPFGHCKKQAVSSNKQVGEEVTASTIIVFLLSIWAF